MALLNPAPGAVAPSPVLGASKSSFSSVVLSRTGCSRTRLRNRDLVARAEAVTQEGVTASITKSCLGITEVDKDSFWPLVDEAGDKVVVLDMYTQWCGPCKMMLPKIAELSAKYSDVMFLKLDCNQNNKPLAKELGIRVVPTFKILRHKKIVAEITGAKLDELVRTIDTVLAA